MKSLFILSTLITLSFSSLIAQSCGNVFSEPTYTVNETLDIVYGNNTTLGGTNLDLKMDVYYPASTNAEKFPLVVFAHSGSFIGGSKSDYAVFCKNLAAHGMVVSSMNYRLIDQLFLDSNAVISEVFYAVSDMKAALRYFIEDYSNANSYGIDTSAIFVSGASAGAITALHTAFMDEDDIIPAYVSNVVSQNGGFTGNSSSNTNLTYSIKGVLNYSGALLDASWVQNNTDIKIYSIHTEFDETVPCGTGIPLGNNPLFPEIETQGSCEIHPTAQNAQMSSQFWFLDDQTYHLDYFTNALSDQVHQNSVNFVIDVLCAYPLNISKEQKSSVAILYPNPSSKTETLYLNPSLKGTVHIYDILGQKVSDFSTSSLNELRLSSGTYTVEFRSDALKIRQKLIVTD